MDGEGQPGDSQPNLAPEIDDESLDEELVGASVQEVEEPLLGGVGSMMPDVPSHETLLLVEVVLAVPSSVLHFGHSQTFSVHETHVLCVSEFVMSQSTT